MDRIGRHRRGASHRLFGSWSPRPRDERERLARNQAVSHGAARAYQKAAPANCQLQILRSFSISFCAWSRFVTNLETSDAASSSATTDAPRLALTFASAPSKRVR